MSDLVLGIDLGTSGVKVGILEVDSMELAHVAFREYDNSAVQDTDVLFEMTLKALKESVSTVDDKKQIKAIGLTGQMHGAVLYNQTGEIIHPLINWQERKYSSNLVVEKIKAIFGPARSEDTGIDMASGLTGAILFGIQENHPDLFARIDKFLLPVDFIRGKLLDRIDHVTDQTNAFGTGLFNTRDSRWHDELIQKLNLPMGIFPNVKNTSDIVGNLCDDIVHKIGLEKTIPIIIGGGDNQMSMLGSGLLFQSSPALINIGTAAQISMVTDDYIRVPGLDTRSYFEDTYAFVGASLAGGGSYQWLRDVIRAESGFDISYAEMDQLAALVPAGADGLIFCPGPSRSHPERAMGFYGSTDYVMDIGHRAKAVMEGVVFDLYELYLGIRPYNCAEIMVGSGKGLQDSSVWAQIASNIFGKQIRITKFENALFGAAIMAAFGISSVKDFGPVLSSIRYEQCVRPSPDQVTKYQDEVFNHWRAVVNLA